MLSYTPLLLPAAPTANPHRKTLPGHPSVKALWDTQQQEDATGAKAAGIKCLLAISCRAETKVHPRKVSDSRKGVPSNTSATATPNHLSFI